MNKKIVVIILTYNSEKIIKKTINNIEKSNKVLAAMTEHELVDHGISNLKILGILILTSFILSLFINIVFYYNFF